MPNTETQIEYVEEAPPQNETHAEEPERPVTRISSKSYSGVASPSVKKNSLTIVEESLYINLIPFLNKDEIHVFLLLKIFQAFRISYKI